MNTNTGGRITYGNLALPGRQGLLGLSLPVFLAGLVGLGVSMFFFIATEWWVGLLIALVWFAVMTPMVIPVSHGRNLYQWAGLHRAQRKASRKHTNILINGPAGKVPDGKFTLPGLAAQSVVTDYDTAFGVPFAIVSIPSTDHHTVVLEVHPTGNELVDQSVIDGQVAQWGAWLAFLGTEEGIVAASVTVETSIDSGLRLRKATLTPVREDSSDFGKAVAGELSKGFGMASPAISTRIAITFTGKVAGEKKGKSMQQVSEEIANQLPTLMDSLRNTGAGSHVTACTSQDLADYVRAAYDPHVAPEIEEQRAAGGTGLTWDQAGPAFHQVELDHYFHDRAISTSWTLGGEPRGTFYDTSLARLLAPERKVARKRVTLLYRPIPAARATSIADRKVRNAEFVARSARSQRAISSSVQRAAVQTAEEEAAGAGMTLFGMVVTATVLSKDELRTARQIIASQGAQARLRLRPALGSQDTAFVAALPLGVVLPFHTAIPATITDTIA
ncbi:SCO6880 family protein [Brachybacterium epidermidis]|uniref:SCO6880 family protein n=1 Tax=Brachybacterium epidermidis TaxID=2781983 RepID=UPI00398E96E9